MTTAVIALQETVTVVLQELELLSFRLLEFICDFDKSRNLIFSARLS